MGSDELSSFISIQIWDLKSELALLTKVIDDLKMMGVVWVQVIMYNFCMIHLEPVRLVCMPLHFQYDLSVRLITPLVKILKISTLYKNLDYS